MTTGRQPMDRDNQNGSEPDDAKRKLAITLAALTLLLVVILFIFFYWWNEEGQETEPEDVTRWSLVVDASSYGGDSLTLIAA